MTEIGFVSLLVAGFGALAGALVYVGARWAKDCASGPGRPSGRIEGVGRGRS